MSMLMLLYVTVSGNTYIFYSEFLYKLRITMSISKLTFGGAVGT